MDWKRLEWWVVVLVAIHSFVVGLVLIGLSRWAASFGGWGDADLVFFVRQGGAFHLVVATGYVMEYFRYGTVRLLLFAKSVGVVFLTLSWLMDFGGAWAVPFSALGDASMLFLIWFVHKKALTADQQVNEQSAD